MSLGLSGCGLYGEFPIEIFKLRNLQFLSVHDNQDLRGYLPEFHSSSPLQILRLADTGFFGKLPDSIGNLPSLYELDIYACNFSGLIPTSIGNLTILNNLGLSYNNFFGQIPFSLANLTQLSQLDLSFNSFSPQTLSWLGKQTNLTLLDLGHTNSYGDIPSSLKNLTQLTRLELYNLTSLQLSDVHLSFPLTSTVNASTPKLKLLELLACNLTEFPIFLRFQHELKTLYLSNNDIHGQIPKWIFNMGKQTLLFLDLSFNYLTGFESFNHTSLILPWASLLILNLNSNKLNGSLPIPPPSIVKYNARSNTLTGKISPLFCNLSSIEILDLSHNNLSGMLPRCLDNLSKFLLVLSLRNNDFRGILPTTYMEGSTLKVMDVSYNQLEGQIPRSLSNCTMLEILLLSNNQFNDIFPSWLGKLPSLKVLSLRSNGFHSSIGKPKSNFEFPKLHIIDLSDNKFTGNLPYEYFQCWNSMKVANLTYSKVGNLTYAVSRANPIYLIVLFTITSQNFVWYGYFSFSLELTNKGIEIVYEKVQDTLKVVDLSNNRFEGEISEVIGNLKGLHLLNLSNNCLTGHIPSLLGNLTELESLDFSQNNLSGQISQQLLQLTFLAFFNVSNNHLTGPIPQGQQFATFQSNSYLGNTGLCGSPLTKNCETSTQPPPNPKQGEGSNFPSKSDWVVIMMGYGSGLVVGLVIGNNLNIRKLERVVENLRRRQ
ncbi:receptor-like protein 6 [Quercus suber]|uniref:Receptor-like protein 6 n=1 Tax=Quercus suber TaxID=58331 RepID=A0AAW0M2M9_QUESU